MNNTVYTSKEKNYEFSSKKPSATKHSPPSNVYYIVFCRNFLFQYSLIGIVKPKFTRKNEIWCRIWEIEDLSKNVRKTQDRTSLITVNQKSAKGERSVIVRKQLVYMFRHVCEPQCLSYIRNLIFAYIYIRICILKCFVFTILFAQVWKW